MVRRGAGDYQVADGYFGRAAAFNHRSRQVLRRPNQFLVGEDAHRTRRRRRHKPGPHAADRGHTAACTHDYRDIERRSAETLANLN
jgi:hypothetical protein